MFAFLFIYLFSFSFVCLPPDCKPLKWIDRQTDTQTDRHTDRQTSRVQGDASKEEGPMDERSPQIKWHKAETDCGSPWSQPQGVSAHSITRNGAQSTKTIMVPADTVCVTEGSICLLPLVLFCGSFSTEPIIDKLEESYFV